MANPPSNPCAASTGSGPSVRATGWPPDYLRFLRRTAWATALTLGVVASVAAARWDPRWAVHYLLAGGWAAVFFGLTPWTLHAALVARRPARALVGVAAKILWMAVLLVAWQQWGGTMAPARSMSAMLGGVLTPLVVGALRAAGASLDARTSGFGRPSPRTPADGAPSNGRAGDRQGAIQR